MLCLDDHFTLNLTDRDSQSFLPNPSRTHSVKSYGSLSRVVDKIGNSSTICDFLYQRISKMKNDRS